MDYLPGLLPGRLPGERIRGATPPLRRAGALSGGLIGSGTPRVYPGDLAGTPVFLGCSDVDPHIPPGAWKRAAALEQLGAAVTMRLYPGMDTA